MYFLCENLELLCDGGVWPVPNHAKDIVHLDHLLPILRVDADQYFVIL